MKTQYDASLQSDYRDNSSDGVSLETYVENNANVLSLFADPDDVRKVIAAGDKYELVPEEVQRLVRASITARTIYKGLMFASAGCSTARRF